MNRNSKQTSTRIATLASETLHSGQASKVAKSLAASALSQAGTARQTGAKMETTASRVLQSDKYASTTKELAASVLAQANKKR